MYRDQRIGESESRIRKAKSQVFFSRFGRGRIDGDRFRVSCVLLSKDRIRDGRSITLAIRVVHVTLTHRDGERVLDSRERGVVIEDVSGYGTATVE